MTESDRQLWERQVEEPSKWYERFIYYMELGPDRTLDQAFRNWWEATNLVSPRKRGRPKRPPSSWYPAADRYGWLARAEAWDDEQRRVMLEAQAEERKSMLKRHIEISMAIQRAAITRLKAILEKGQTDTLSTRDVVAYLEKGISLERQARGFPDEILEFWSLSDEELLAKYAEIYKRLEGVGGTGDDDADEGDSGTGKDPLAFGDEEV